MRPLQPGQREFGAAKGGDWGFRGLGFIVATQQLEYIFFWRLRSAQYIFSKKFTIAQN